MPSAIDVPNIRTLLQDLPDKVVAEAFINAGKTEVFIVFLDGSRLLLTGQFTDVAIQQTNGKGGWV